MPITEAWPHTHTHTLRCNLICDTPHQSVSCARTFRDSMCLCVFLCGKVPRAHLSHSRWTQWQDLMDCTALRRTLADMWNGVWNSVVIEQMNWLDSNQMHSGYRRTSRRWTLAVSDNGCYSWSMWNVYKSVTQVLVFLVFNILEYVVISQDPDVFLKWWVFF